MALFHRKKADKETRWPGESSARTTPGKNGKPPDGTAEGLSRTGMYQRLDKKQQKTMDRIIDFLERQGD